MDSPLPSLPKALKEQFNSLGIKHIPFFLFHLVFELTSPSYLCVTFAASHQLNLKKGSSETRQTTHYGFMGGAISWLVTRLPRCRHNLLILYLRFCSSGRDRPAASPCFHAAASHVTVLCLHTKVLYRGYNSVWLTTHDLSVLNCLT